jgi:hypothetical protein
VAVLVYEALLERRLNGGEVAARAPLVVVVTAVLGGIDEAS